MHVIRVHTHANPRQVRRRPPDWSQYSHLNRPVAAAAAAALLLMKNVVASIAQIQRSVMCIH